MMIISAFIEFAVSGKVYGSKGSFFRLIEVVVKGLVA